MPLPENPFRSAAEMVADGTIQRPAYLDDSPFAERPSNDERPTGATVTLTAPTQRAKQQGPADRVGRLMR